MGIYKKIYELQKVLNSYDWEKDGINRHQSYKYITEAQYKRNFAKALIEVGLIFQIQELERRFRTDVLNSTMHLVEVDFIGTLIDIDTGEKLDYYFSGTGADTGDKALYKAYTGALKYFIATNFMVAEGNDPENDEQVDKAKYVSEDEKKEIKKDLTFGQANKMQIEALKKQLTMLIKKDDKYKEVVRKIQEETNDLQNITKTQCEDYIIKIGRLLKEEVK